MLGDWHQWSSGCGKTTLATEIATKLNQQSESIATLACSIDQFYLTHQDQSVLAAACPSNPLVQHRGQPSTHDLPLAIDVLQKLQQGIQTQVPQYDKSAFGGQGDRAPQVHWPEVNGPDQQHLKLIILEGWCIGFRALAEADLKARWEKAILQQMHGGYEGRLAFHNLGHLHFINAALAGYRELMDAFDSIIHLDAEDPHFAYDWRIEQERALRAAHDGRGMSDDQVTTFVDGYYPAYELYIDNLRNEAATVRRDRLRLVLRQDRSIKQVVGA